MRPAQLTLCAVLLGISLSSCTATERARRVLVNEGYTDIVLDGAAPFACSQGDYFSDEFYAMRGTVLIEGVVCCGFYTCEVRLY